MTKVKYYRFLPINHLRPLLSSPIGWKSKQNLILELIKCFVYFSARWAMTEGSIKVIYREKSIIIRFCRYSKFINLHRIYFYSFWNKDLLLSTRHFYKCGNCHLIISQAFISIWFFKKVSFLFMCTVQKIFLIWISRSFKNGANDNTISYFDQSFRLSGLLTYFGQRFGEIWSK